MIRHLRKLITKFVEMCQRQVTTECMLGSLVFAKATCSGFYSFAMHPFFFFAFTSRIFLKSKSKNYFNQTILARIAFILFLAITYYLAQFIFVFFYVQPRQAIKFLFCNYSARLVYFYSE